MNLTRKEDTQIDSQEIDQFYDSLEKVVLSWPNLSEKVRESILTIIELSEDRGSKDD